MIWTGVDFLKLNNGLSHVVNPCTRGGMDGWQGCSEGFPEGKARGKSQEAALPARGETRPSQLFYSDLHSFSNTYFFNIPKF